MNIVKLCRWLTSAENVSKKYRERNAGVSYKMNVQKVN